MIEWATFTELNNHYFILETSSDLENWEELTRIDGAGTSTETSFYNFQDESSKTSTTYYRLTQVDFDGQQQSFKISVIENRRMEITSSVTFNNPTTDFLNLENYEIELGSYQVVDVYGKTVNDLVKLTSKNSLDVKRLPSGMYVFSGKDGVFFRFIKI